jgi:hypothetical protein
MSYTNGFTRQLVTVKASGATTTTGQTAGFPTGYQNTIDVFVDATAVSGTTPSLTVNVEWSYDNATWFAGDTADSFTAATAAQKRVKEFAVKGQYARLNYTIRGTTPSFTWAATALIGD